MSAMEPIKSYINTYKSKKKFMMSTKSLYQNYLKWYIIFFYTLGTFKLIKPMLHELYNQLKIKNIIFIISWFRKHTVLLI